MTGEPGTEFSGLKMRRNELRPASPQDEIGQRMQHETFDCLFCVISKLVDRLKESSQELIRSFQCLKFDSTRRFSQPRHRF